MYGLIGKMTVLPGERDALIAILLEGTGEMPGCLSYVVAKDPADADAIWITEVWDNQASHQASLSLPAVRQAIARGKPLIAGFGAATSWRGGGRSCRGCGSTRSTDSRPARGAPRWRISSAGARSSWFRRHGEYDQR